MMRNFILSVVIVALSGFVLSGCGQGSAEASSSTGSSKAAPSKDGKQKVNGATVIHEPPKDGNIPEGGMVLQPPNPNDPKFKADPRLAGGG